MIRLDKAPPVLAPGPSVVPHDRLDEPSTEVHHERPVGIGFVPEMKREQAFDKIALRPDINDPKAEASRLQGPVLLLVSKSGQCLTLEAFQLSKKLVRFTDEHLRRNTGAGQEGGYPSAAAFPRQLRFPRILIELDHFFDRRER
jgi:hypothetical protein